MSRRPERRRSSPARPGAAAEPAAGRPGAEPPERLEVRVQVDCVVPVPRLIVRLFDLVPGDMILLEPEAGGVGVRPHRELMRQWLDRPVEELVRSLDSLWPRQGGMFGPGRTLYLLPQVFPVRPGQVMVWEVEDLGRHVRLSLRRKRPAPGTPKPGEAPGRRTMPAASAGAVAQRSQRSQPGPSRPRPRAPGGGRP